MIQVNGAGNVSLLMALGLEGDVDDQQFWCIEMLGELFRLDDQGKRLSSELMAFS